MKCTNARPLLDLLSDGVLDTKDSALMLDHLKSCNECQCEWHDLEQLRSRFDAAEEERLMSEGLMERISQSLNVEDNIERQRTRRRYCSPISLLAIAAACLLVGFFCLPQIQQIDSRQASANTISANTLIADLTVASAINPIEDRNELDKELGYNLKYVRLPTWHMENSGISNMHTPLAIARFDFVKNSASGSQHLSCYQARAGMIRANGQPKIIGGKRVLFGNREQYQFALWSQDGRDYLVVTTLPGPLLEAVVREA
jgi:hypothetical protein